MKKSVKKYLSEMGKKGAEVTNRKMTRKQRLERSRKGVEARRKLSTSKDLTDKFKDTTIITGL